MRRRLADLEAGERWLLAFYVVVAASALVLTWWQNIEYFTTADDAGILGFVESGFVNPAAASLTLDVLLVGIVCQVFMLIEGRRLGMPVLGLVGFVVAGAVVAISVAFPLFLALRLVTRSALAPSGGGAAKPR